MSTLLKALLAQVLKSMADKANASKTTVEPAENTDAAAVSLLLYSDDYASIPKKIDKFIGIGGQYNTGGVAQSLVDIAKGASPSTDYRNVIDYSDKPKSNIPALLIEGSLDEFDNAALTGQGKTHSNWLADYIGRNNAAIYTVQGANHGYSFGPVLNGAVYPGFNDLLTAFEKA